MRQLTSVFTAVVVAVLLTGCSSSDDDSKEKFTIMTQQIQLIVGESQKIEASGGFTARSTNEDVATVSADGTVTAVSEGDADVIFTPTGGGQSQTCHVRADWRYHYFDEPILDFDLGMEQVKAKETHRLISETSDYGGSLTYSYDNQEIPMEVIYVFGDHGFSVYLSWAQADGVIEKIKLQMTERFDECIGWDHIEGDAQYYSNRLGVFVSVYEEKHELFYRPGFYL